MGTACVDARARRGRASHSLASPFLAAPRQRDGGWFYLRRRKGAAGACFAQPRLPLLVARRVSVMRERRRLVSTHVDARAQRGRASHSPASPFLAAPRQRDGGWFYLRRRKVAAGAGVLRTAPQESPFFWLRRVSETAAGFYMRRLTHGRCWGGGVVRTAPPPPFLGCAASERRRLVSTCVDARARRGRASHITAPPLLVSSRPLYGGLFLHA